MSYYKSEPLAADLLASFSAGPLAWRATSESAVGLPADATSATEVGTSERRTKNDFRIEAYGAINEANSAIGLARVATATDPDCARVDAMLLCVQNDLFDLSADLCIPKSATKPDREPLRIVQSQVDRLERKIDELNADLAPLLSFILPGGSPAASALHLARTVTRRAERVLVALANEPGETVGKPALKYVNRLSDFLFVTARYVNRKGEGDILWVPGQNRKSSAACAHHPCDWSTCPTRNAVARPSWRWSF
jgi:cob(I)alamin adenosyltransferase